MKIHYNKISAKTNIPPVDVDYLNSDPQQPHYFSHILLPYIATLQDGLFRTVIIVVTSKVFPVLKLSGNFFADIDKELLGTLQLLTS